MFKRCIIVITSSLLIACGGGSGSENKSTNTPIVIPPPPSYSIYGFGIKGPLSNAVVNLYVFDSSLPQSQGELVAQGATNSKTEITDLSLSGEPEGYYVLEFSAAEGTLDVSMQSAPIITRFRTLVSAEQIIAGDPIYASPLSSLTLAIAELEINNGVAVAEAIANAEHQAKAYFGLGLDSETQLLNGSAMLSGEGESVEQQLKALELRRAIEAFSIVLSQILESIQDTTFSEDELIDQLALDMLDGVLDASTLSDTVLSYGIEHIDLFKPSMNTFEFPNAQGLTLIDLAQIMVDETRITLGSDIGALDFVNHAPYSTHNHFSLKADLDGDGIYNSLDSDDDNDSVPDSDDAFPFDESEHLDTDIDGIGNNADSDDDNDGFDDEEDAFPLDKMEWIDTDEDGIGNNADSDDDNDGFDDEEDAFPLNKMEWLDTDEDGIGNNADSDDDNDGFDDQEDAFPLDKMEWIDTDEDGIGNNADSDDDNDGVYDNDDELPLDPTESVDFDNDGIGDNADNDDDNDNIVDANDNIHVSALKNIQVSVNEELTYFIRGFFDNGTLLDSANGWHVQYYITDLSKNEEISFYTSNGYYNASFLNEKKEWQVTFPAPSYSGEFQVRFSLYCSKAEGVCAPNTDQTKYHHWDQLANFTVVCESTPCGYQPEPEPGRNISASSDINYQISATKKENGNVVTAYVQLTENNWRTYIAESPNKGYSWSRLSYLPKYTLSGVLIESHEETSLMMMAICGLSYCLYESEDGGRWTTTDLFNTTNFMGCLGADCDINGIRVRSFTVLNDGSYMVTYDNTEMGHRATYKTTTSSLEHWTEPTLLFNQEKTSLHSLVQLESGRFVASYDSYDDNASFVAFSDDGENWNNILRFHTFGSKLLNDNGKIRLFYRGVDHKLYEQHTVDFESMSTPKKVVDKVDEKFDVVSYGNGEFGIIYTLDLNFQFDVFHEKVSVE